MTTVETTLRSKWQWYCLLLRSKTAVTLKDNVMIRLNRFLTSELKKNTLSFKLIYLFRCYSNTCCSDYIRWDLEPIRTPMLLKTIVIPARVSFKHYLRVVNWWQGEVCGPRSLWDQHNIAVCYGLAHGRRAPEPWRRPLADATLGSTFGESGRGT